MRWHVVLALRSVDPAEPAVSETLPAVPPEARGDEHLRQWMVVRPEAPAAVTAHYVFDETYARHHPEALDLAHLRLLSHLLACKLFDDGDLVVLDRQLEGSLRWPAWDVPRKALTA